MRKNDAEIWENCLKITNDNKKLINITRKETILKISILSGINFNFDSKGQSSLSYLNAMYNMDIFQRRRSQRLQEKELSKFLDEIFGDEVDSFKFKKNGTIIYRLAWKTISC